MLRKRRKRNWVGRMGEGTEYLSCALRPENHVIACKAVLVTAILGMMLVSQNAWTQEDDQERNWTEEVEPERSPLFVSWEASGVTPRAKRILSDMCKLLASAQEFTFHAEEAHDSLLWNGQKVQIGGRATVTVRRPDGLHIEYRGDERKTRAVFDGQKFTVHNIVANLYTVIEAPSEIDAALDHLFDEYGVSVPVEDLLYSDPYSTLMESVQSGFVIGRHNVEGVPCEHLVFSQETIDWQIWIEAGPKPVPRKLLITYKKEPNSPQYMATFSNWDFEPSISDEHFKFNPPAGADEIEFLPVEESDVKP